MIDYAENTSKWESWQRDYRLGLILIIPPPEVSHQIDTLRAKYDARAFTFCPTHISVSDPLRREMTPELEEEILNILNEIKPFTLHYDRPHASTEHAGVAYPIRPQEPIEDSLKLCVQLQDSAPSGSFLCDRLEFIVPNESFHFQRRGTFFLGGFRENESAP
jgi:hypothetical protein